MIMKANKRGEFRMFRRLSFGLVLLPVFLSAQVSLDDFIQKAAENSPALKEYENLRSMNKVQAALNRAQNSGFQMFLTGDYLFAPYFNNPAGLVTTDPSPRARGYDINLTDGGLYSAKINLERNVLNGGLTGVLDRQIRVQDGQFQQASIIERHSLEKQVTDQYLNALRLQRLARVSEETVAALREQTRLAAGLAAGGNSSLQDYLLLKIEYRNQSILLDDARQQVRSGLLQLHALCGIADTTVTAVDSVALKPGPPVNGSRFTGRYALDSLSVLTEQTLFETRYGPQLRMFLNTGLDAVELSGIDRRFGMSAGLNLSLPLFDGHQRRLTAEQKRMALNTIRESRRYLEATVALQRVNYMKRIESLGKSIAGMAEQIEDYRKLLDLSSKQLRQGGLSMIDYLTLVRNFADLRKNAIGLEIDLQLETNNYNYWNW
jgi:outer membrane protein TolC